MFYRQVSSNKSVPQRSSPIEEFRLALSGLNVDAVGAEVYLAMLKVLESDFSGKFLAVLFKSPVSSKQVFDRAQASIL